MKQFSVRFFLSKQVIRPQLYLMGYLILSSILVGCGNPYNSNFSDALRFGGTVSGSANFQSARSVFLNRCFTCHSQWSSWTESDFVSNGLISSRSPSDSTLYTRIRGNDSGVAGNMPPSENLSTDEMLAIKTWILNM